MVVAANGLCSNLNHPSGRAQSHVLKNKSNKTAGIRVLDHLGVFEQVQALGFVHEYGTLVNIKGDPIGKLVLGSKERYDYPAVRLYRNSLRQVLLAEASRQGIEIRYDMRCIKVHNETNDSVTVKFANGELITADLVIGTDGMNSQVREYIAPNVDPAFTGQAAVIAFAEKSELRDLEKIHDTKMILGTEGSFAIMPADGAGDEIMFFSTIETHERTKEEWQEFNTNKRALKDVLQNPFSNENWPHIVRFLIKETPAETFFCWP
jgi:2-polyprenyl-6-methoxyphenol hydroxylase-like FAD-dependent oxidoreductase